MRSRTHISCATATLLLVAITTPALAQDVKTVDVLAFERFDVDDEVMGVFYSSLERGISDHPEMEVAPGTTSTLDDMLFTLGCSEEEEGCLSSLQDLLPVNRVVFGSVQRTEDIYMFTIKMYDLNTGAYTHMIEDQTVQGDLKQLERVVPTLIDSMLYGRVGVLEVSVDGPPRAKVLFDGAPIGSAPDTFKELPLGEHVVTVRHGEQEESRKVVLSRSEPTSMEVRFVVPETIGSNDDGKVSPLLVPGVAVAGVGLGAIAFGVVSQLQLADLEYDTNTRYGDKTEVSIDELDAVLTRKDDLDSAYTRMVIGYSIGAVGAAAGAALVYMAITEGDERDVGVIILPSPDGASVQLNSRF